MDTWHLEQQYGALFEEQIALEHEYSETSLLRGIQQQKEALRTGRIVDSSLKTLMQRMHFVTAEALKQRLQSNARGLNAKYLGLVRQVDTDVAVGCAVRSVLAVIANPEKATMQQTLQSIGKMLEAEALLVHIEKINPTYAKRVLERFERIGSNTPDDRRKALLSADSTLGDTWCTWTPQERVGCARVLLECMYETGLFEWQRGVGGMLTPVPTPELQEHLLELLEVVRPILTYPPMLIPPRDWVQYKEGGYYTVWWQEHAPMLSLRSLPKQYRREVLDSLKAPETQELRDVLNATQRVAYKINREVLQRLQEAISQKNPGLGLPAFFPAPKPNFPFDEATFDKEHLDAQEAAKFTLWKRQMHDWYSDEAHRFGRVCGVLNAIKGMSRFRDKKQLYFPVFLDWRGRLYYRGQFQPQGQDCIKGCLDFAEGVPLGERGLYWLRVHIANCAGFDKAHPDLRAQWTIENTEMLLRWAADPLNLECPEPSTAWTLLQALLAYRDALSLQDPTAYVCHVPVAMDATCSGLQHFSAMFRDEHAAKYVNLTALNADKKQDIYAEVAEQAMRVLPDYCDETQKLYWEGKQCSRSMAKRPVMTFVYGSTLQSTMDYVLKSMLEEGLPAITHTLEDGTEEVLVTQQRLAIPMAKALRAAVAATVPSAAEGMRWLQRLVRQQRDAPVHWTTPLGLKVFNWSERIEVYQVRIRSMGVNAISMYSFTGEYKFSKAVDSIAPNFVHSLDAAHLQLTVLRFGKPVLAVHDSFACHAAYTDGMHKAIREAFYELYSRDVTTLLSGNRSYAEEDKPPRKGLDLTEVLSSVYMFC